MQKRNESTPEWATDQKYDALQLIKGFLNSIAAPSNNHSAPTALLELAKTVNKALDNPDNIPEAINGLRSFLEVCNDLYHLDGESPITDAQFDFLEQCLLKIDSSTKEYTSFKNVTMESVQHKTHKHSTPMLSLDKAYSLQEIESFVKKIGRYLNNEITDIDFVGEPKVDGVAFAALYSNGNYMAGFSRGNGIEGEDMTDNIGHVIGMPKTINYHGDIEVRGEIYISHDDFNQMNSRLAPSEQFGTPRNLAAGTLKLLDSSIVPSRRLRYFAYNVLFKDRAECKTHLESLEFLDRLGFTVSSLYKRLQNLDEIEGYRAAMLEKRPGMQYDCDGLVIKVNSLALQARLGSTEKHPRWAVAYKFSNPGACTFINNITIHIGRTGAIVPVAELNPIKIGGVTIKRATLHNFDNVAAKDIRVGDYVTVERAGDVIPQVTKVMHDNRQANSREFIAPKECPSCGTSLIRDDEDKNVILRCPAALTCPAQKFARLVHMVSRDGFDIDGMGEKQLKQLWDLNIINRPSDIFALKPSNLEGLPRWGDKSIKNMIGSIGLSRSHITLDRFIFALGIRHVGKDIAKILAVHYHTLDVLVKNACDQHGDMEGINKIGPKIIQSVVDFWSFAENRDEVNRLASLVNIVPLDAPMSSATTEFTGKKVVFTGKLSSISRDEAKDLMIRLGAVVSNSVTAKTDYVIVGEKAGSKLTKSQDTKARVLNEEEWLSVVGRYKSDTL